MKKSFLLIVACVFAFATVQAQSSEVEATTQQTKAEQFKQRGNSLSSRFGACSIHTIIYRFKKW